MATPWKGSALSHPTDGSEVQAITRASRILAALEASPGGLSLAQIAQRVELPRSTVHRIVKALTTERFLVPVSSAGGVRLGPRLAGLASAALGELRQQIRPHLERLSERSEEHTSELQSRPHLVCRLLLEKKKKKTKQNRKNNKKNNKKITTQIYQNN